MWHDWLARCNDVGIEVEIDECYLTRRKYNQGRVTKTGTVTILGLYERATQLGVHLQVSVRVLTTIRKSKSRSTALTVKCLIWVSGDTDTCLALSLSLSLTNVMCDVFLDCFSIHICQSYYQTSMGILGRGHIFSWTLLRYVRLLSSQIALSVICLSVVCDVVAWWAETWTLVRVAFAQGCFGVRDL